MSLADEALEQLRPLTTNSTCKTGPADPVKRLVSGDGPVLAVDAVHVESIAAHRAMEKSVLTSTGTNQTN